MVCLFLVLESDCVYIAHQLLHPFCIIDLPVSHSAFSVVISHMILLSDIAVSNLTRMYI